LFRLIFFPVFFFCFFSHLLLRGFFRLSVFFLRLPWLLLLFYIQSNIAWNRLLYKLLCDLVNSLLLGFFLSPCPDHCLLHAYPEKSCASLFNDIIFQPVARDAKLNKSLCDGIIQRLCRYCDL